MKWLVSLLIVLNNSIAGAQEIYPFQLGDICSDIAGLVEESRDVDPGVIDYNLRGANEVVYRCKEDVIVAIVVWQFKFQDLVQRFGPSADEIWVLPEIVVQGVSHLFYKGGAD